MDYEERYADACAVYDSGMCSVNTSPAPAGQKFPIGSRVHIAEDLGSSMSHFQSGKDATVRYTYAHAYGGGNIKDYCLDIDGYGEVSWYQESQLSLLR